MSAWLKWLGGGGGHSGHVSENNLLLLLLVANGVDKIFGIVGSAFMDALDIFPAAGIRYSPFHKTLPKSSLQMHWISVRFYETGVMSTTFWLTWDKPECCGFILFWLGSTDLCVKNWIQISLLFCFQLFIFYFLSKI